ncbi:Spore photoproduct lyase [bioreactor metagenome]|uniref:Spore photoproduct lyase n=1 Tax=bioreactor metagenome TaxID=1076179 RepID=A0A645HT89_9ZZZZ
MVEPLLALNHQGKTIFRMSVNPQEIIQRIELGTSSLESRIKAVNSMCDAGYPVGLLIAPVIFIPDWKQYYSDLIDQLSDQLNQKVKKTAFLEIIFMTYSFVQNAINTEAFPGAIALYDKSLMTGRGRGKYCYRDSLRAEGENFLREQLNKKLPEMKILYVV